MRSRLLILTMGVLSGIALIVGCSSEPPPDTSPSEPKQKTDLDGVGKGETLEAPPPPPGMKKK